MPQGHVYRRNTRQTTLHHVCGHSTQNYTLDCFTVGRVRKLEAGPCRDCHLRATTELLTALVLGMVVSGRFVEDETHRLIDDERVRCLPGNGNEQIILTFPKVYPLAIAVRHESDGAALYTVLYRPTHIKSA